ncbi:uncharacterized protein [Symphalangus syndactylus]|uniref:uncharacterized protein n=1 Tax=Symphalangus syndactylus TaxID=9590 RepID=UPI003004B666
MNHKLLLSLAVYLCLEAKRLSSDVSAIRGLWRLELKFRTFHGRQVRDALPIEEKSGSLATAALLSCSGIQPVPTSQRLRLHYELIKPPTQASAMVDAPPPTKLKCPG